MGIVSRSQGGSGSGGTVLFDSTLGAPAANIDTGAAGIAAGFNILEVVIIARTADAAAVGQINLTFNNDTGANYDWQNVAGVAAAASASSGVAQTSVAIVLHGDGGTAAYPGVCRLTIPGYTQTTFNKAGEMTVARPDGTAGNGGAIAYSVGWRNTAAITRATVTGATANLKAGSRLLILGR